MSPRARVTCPALCVIKILSRAEHQFRQAEYARRSKNLAQHASQTLRDTPCDAAVGFGAAGALGFPTAAVSPSRVFFPQDMPFSMLQRDWRFWISILGGFSLFTAMLESMALVA